MNNLHLKSITARISASYHETDTKYFRINMHKYVSRRGKTSFQCVSVMCKTHVKNISRSLLLLRSQSHADLES